MSAFAEATIGTERLLLTPLCIADADEMVDVLPIRDSTSSSVAAQPPFRSCAPATRR